MPKRILIDATHIEETRVVLLENGRIQEFDSETSIKKQLKGNVYLAKVTRVEPSLQAAFADYGGEKHGFLPFSEIHPDYYNIPVEDKKQLLQSMRSNGTSRSSDDEDVSEPDENVENESDSEISTIESEEDNQAKLKGENLYKRYKIQEVIKRNQIILVQVEKEERGNKGASLTSFISLAGKYCVLMPNALRPGGVSRRIESIDDRRRLKKIISGLNISEDAGLIVRTAGAKQGEKEIKDDYSYLANLWNDIRKLTLKSKAPAFIHCEGDLIKRTIRDLYNDQVDEVLIEGEKAYSDAKDFMKTVTPSATSRIKKYKNKVPVFSRYKVEEQISELYSQEALLESGGSIVINPTEALISIDVNSGRSTSQRSVEETAKSTNLEAAYEIARQLKLRDLSGLIVIDFIDMLELRNRKAIERALRDAFGNDRAKIQIGRISNFGLLEMSRQRLRASFLEVNTMVCPNCNGAGFVKATESTAVTVLRAIENDVSRGSSCEAVDVYVATNVAIYILNYKRREFAAIEDLYKVRVFLNQDETLGSDGFAIDKIKHYSTQERGGYPDYSSRKSSQNPKNGKSKKESEYSPSENNDESEVIPFPSRKEDNHSSSQKSRSKKLPEDASLQRQGVSGILHGLWEKIID